MAWDSQEFSPGLFRVQFRGLTVASHHDLVYEKDKGIIYSAQEWKNNLLSEQSQTYVMKPAGTVPGAIPSQERVALIALYNSTNGDNWDNKSGWKTPPLAADGFALPGTENTWYGITCDTSNTTVQIINPRHNNMHGPLPPELGNLANVDLLFLNSNRHSASIPSNLNNLTMLTMLDLRWNALYTSDEILRAFLDSRQKKGYWESTQTIAPSNVTATVLSTSSIRINWTPIAYTSDTGGYRVFYSTTHGGPYTCFGMTADKTASSLTVIGLNPDTTYYFAIKTRTNPHTNNQNKVVSGYSAEVSVLTHYPLTLTSPNGGESGGLRTVQNITWTSSGLTGNLRIELWKANKKFCIIAANIPIANGNYAWTVGNNTVVQIPAGNDYKVKIITENGLYNDISDGTFFIVK